MRDTMAEHKLPKPEFEQKTADGGTYAVRVTLRNSVKTRKVFVDAVLRDILAEPLLKTLDQREKTVLSFVIENKQINVAQCQRQLEIARWHTAQRFLMKMTRKGLLRYHAPAKERGRSYFTLVQTGADREIAK
ncbi:MAG: hypothetical protein JW741_15590 [Sedimentisphaerales bacterium]|nr:hypothetical protein [Sedimentisphaerales bacterium]